MSIEFECDMNENKKEAGIGPFKKTVLSMCNDSSIYKQTDLFQKSTLSRISYSTFVAISLNLDTSD